MRTVQSLDGTSVNTQIALSFTDRMNVRSVERAFSISPGVRGDFNWAGNTLLFSPRKSLAYGTQYHVVVSPQATDTTGRHLFKTFAQTFTTQQQHLLYLGTAGDERGRLIQASITGARRSIGSDDGSITDFSVSPDGSLATYVRRGSSGERPDEIWLVSLADGSTQRLFRRPDWTITQPRLSPDGRFIAFLATNVRLCRKYYGCYRDKTSPIIYLLDMRTRRVKPFESASDVPITDFINFSPAGQIAYTDLGSALTLASVSGNRITHVPNEGNSLEFWGFDTAGDKAAFVGQTPDSTGGDILVYQRGKYVDVSHSIYDSSTPAFSTSGNRIAYAAYRGEQGIEPIYGLNVYSFTSKRTTQLTLGPHSHFSDWAPAWSPDDRYIAFVRSQPQEAMYMGQGTVWVVRSDGSGAHPLGGTGENITWVL
jgi:dipeptidyl aminopeptidase/acylaminoacyl peptidase